MIDHPALRAGSWLIIAGLAVAGAFGMSADRLESAVLLGLAVAGGGALCFQRTLPSGIMLLLIMAATVNAAGYVIGLWHERTMFDEVVHAFTTFAGMTALIWVATRDGGSLNKASGPTIVGAAVLAGSILGLLWEGFEWVFGIIGSQQDTLVDLAMDGVGAVMAGILFIMDPIRRPQSELTAPGRNRPTPSVQERRHPNGR